MTRDTVTFLDQDGPLKAKANWQAKPMADDLAASEYFLARLRDDRFARAVQLVLTETPVVRVATGESMIWPSGQLIGEMIADLRGYGEDACDICFWDDQPPGPGDGAYLTLVTNDDKLCRYGAKVMHADTSRP